MTVCEFFIKSMSVLSAVALSTVVVGREMIMSSPVMHRPKTKRELVKSINHENYALAKLENAVVGRRRISVIRGETGEMPFLCDCINYSFFENDEYFCLYNTNQLLYYSIRGNICVYYRYDCEVGDNIYTPKECYECAKRAIYEVFSGSANLSVTDCVITDNSSDVCTFCFHTNVTDEKNIIVSVRRDTKNIVLFDARDAESIICNETEGIR